MPSSQSCENFAAIEKSILISFSPLSEPLADDIQ